MSQKIIKDFAIELINLEIEKRMSVIAFAEENTMLNKLKSMKVIRKEFADLQHAYEVLTGVRAL